VLPNQAMASFSLTLACTCCARSPVSPLQASRTFRPDGRAASNWLHSQRLEAMRRTKAIALLARSQAVTISIGRVFPECLFPSCNHASQKQDQCCCGIQNIMTHTIVGLRKYPAYNVLYFHIYSR